jgi:hypothetical protein
MAVGKSVYLFGSSVSILFLPFAFMHQQEYEDEQRDDDYVGDTDEETWISFPVIHEVRALIVVKESTQEREQ